MTSLPQAFICRMQKQLGNDAGAFFSAMNQPPLRGIRFNPLKTPDQPVQTQLEGILHPIPWAADGFYITADCTAGSHALHACGAFYLQEPSAMIPATLLDPEPGQTVLDLCAAPGGKSTQLAAMMKGHGLLVCNEPVPSRAAILSGNLERMGITNAVVVSADPSRLAQRWPQLFDMILVDAPCSGEGMFRRHPETREQWSEDAPESCAKRQARIMESAAIMLKPGGKLCYSTCTFNETEDEQVIRAFLQKHSAFKPIDFSIPIGNNQTAFSSDGCLKVYPHQIQGEGHFMALLQKEPDHISNTFASLQSPEHTFNAPSKDALRLFASFWQQVSDAPIPQANAMIGNLLIASPQLPALDKLKVYRTGLHLGRIKGKLFFPEHSLALAAPALNLRNIPLDINTTATYLQGEVLPSDPMDPGFWTVSYSGLPLGFVKHSSYQLKNHYPKGLRQLFRR